MKVTLGEILNPRWRRSASLGNCALALQHLMTSAHGLVKEGHTGPFELLCGYAGCVNLTTNSWHSSRDRLVTFQAHLDNVRDLILSSLCSDEPCYREWRNAHALSLDAILSLRVKDNRHNQMAEASAFEGFMGLNAFRVAASTLNSCHRNVRVLCSPQLFIGVGGIKADVNVTTPGEFRRPSCSSWSCSFLMRKPRPVWSPYRENFAEFLTRATEWFKAAKRADDSRPKVPRKKAIFTSSPAEVDP